MVPVEQVLQPGAGMSVAEQLQHGVYEVCALAMVTGGCAGHVLELCMW